jgi:GNAT superfamily N-acetyltransferase
MSGKEVRGVRADSQRVSSQRVSSQIVEQHTPQVLIRRFDPAQDSFEALNAMLHRAFARLGAMGLNCTCVDQTVDVCRARAAQGVCYVAICAGRIIGTMTLCYPDADSRCELYQQDHVASVRQFGVEPALQQRGIGTLLLAFADHWAATRGFASLALDTPQPAAHLIAFYRAQGFRIADFVRFDGKRYDSAILCRAAVVSRTLAAWSRRLTLAPRRALQRAA